MIDRSDLAERLSPANGEPVWIQVGTLIDGSSSTPLRDAHVVFDRKEIRFVGSAGTTPPQDVLTGGQDSPDLVLPGHSLLPGLIDAHAHLFLRGSELDSDLRKEYLLRSPAAMLEEAEARLEPLLQLGIIGVRDAGDRHGVGLALSRLRRSGSRPDMPYVDSPGTAIHRKGRYGGFMAGAVEEYASIQACVESRVRDGADRIKIIATGIIDFQTGLVTTKPQFSGDEISELVDAAGAHRKQTFAHATGTDGIEAVLKGGVDSVEHGFFVSDAQLAIMRDRQIAWVPTFAPVQAQIDHADRIGWDANVVARLRRILDGHAESLQKAHNLGVPILAGSDAGSMGVPHGRGLYRELELMEEAGLPSIAVINAATGNSALRLGFQDDFGQIKKGFQSRFILTEHDPLKSVSSLFQGRFVLYDGNLFTATREGTKTLRM